MSCCALGLYLMTGRCECSVGYGGDATTSTGCVACAKGLYKTTFGNIACTKCMDGATTPGTASSALSQCQCADANGLLSDGKCLCKAGYSGNAAGGSCVNCASGTYKKDAGNNNCLNCPVGTTCPGGPSFSINPGFQLTGESTVKPPTLAWVKMPSAGGHTATGAGLQPFSVSLLLSDGSLAKEVGGTECLVTTYQVSCVIVCMHRKLQRMVSLLRQIPKR